MRLINLMKTAGLMKTLVLAVVCWSCSSGLNKSDYVAWVRSEEHGLHTRKIVGDYQYEVQYMPKEYIKLLRYGHQVSREQWEQDTTDNQVQVFSLKISCVNNSLKKQLEEMSKEAQQERDYYFTYLLGSAIKLRDEQGERATIFSHFETGRKEYQLAFEEGKRLGEATLVIRSERLYDKPIEIRVSRGPTPKLKI